MAATKMAANMAAMKAEEEAARQAEQDAINAQEMGAQKKTAGQLEQPQMYVMKKPAIKGVGPPPEADAPEEAMETPVMKGVGVPAMKAVGVLAMKGAKGPKMSADQEVAASTNSTIDIRPITIAVNNLNTTINKVLTAIESRLKKNDVNSQLKKMTEFISQINDSLPAPTEGGGTRRANIKKRKKTLRRYRY